MKYLIDTHTFLWFIEGSPQLSQFSKSIIENEDNEIYLSIISLWEISIKTSLNKLSINGNYESIIFDIEKNVIDILPITFAHTIQQNTLPHIHKDPFDRMILSQAITENINILSRDEIFDEYLKPTTIKRIW
ncbi:type II toxin-antitoxin system VapC family toxin [Emticicia sediminis]